MKIGNEKIGYFMKRVLKEPRTKNGIEIRKSVMKKLVIFMKRVPEEPITT